jgi:hypothetical protein
MPTFQDVLFLSGDLFLPKSVRRVLEHYYVGNDRTLIYITNWSLVHFFTGVLTAWVLETHYPGYDTLFTAFLLHTMWEIWQLAVRNTPWTLRGVLDVGMDTLLFLGGFLAYLQVTRDEESIQHV